VGIATSGTLIKNLPMRTKVVHNKSMIRTLKNRKKGKNDKK